MENLRRLQAVVIGPYAELPHSIRTNPRNSLVLNLRSGLSWCPRTATFSSGRWVTLSFSFPLAPSLPRDQHNLVKGNHSRTKMAGRVAVARVTSWCNEEAKMKMAWPLAGGHVWKTVEENTWEWDWGDIEGNNFEQLVPWGLRWHDLGIKNNYNWDP